jgi:hypothetical protein
VSGDTLVEMLAIVRATAPDLPADRLLQIEAAIREAYGGRDNYIARRAKRTHLETLERAAAMDMDLTAQQLADMLGVSVRHAKRLKRLQGG